MKDFFLPGDMVTDVWIPDRHELLIQVASCVFVCLYRHCVFSADDRCQADSSAVELFSASLHLSLGKEENVFLFSRRH